MSDTSFNRKRIDLTLTLGTGAFGDTVGDTVTLTGLRAEVRIENCGGDAMSALQLRVWGLKESVMNKLTTIGPVSVAIRNQNTVSVSAGTDDGMRLVYHGTIDQAFADYRSAPEVALNISAMAGLNMALKPVGAISYRGAANVSQIMGDIAKSAGLAFVDLGVSARLSNPYFPGSARDQMLACAKAANVHAVVDRGTLYIWPKTGAQARGMPIISPESGMVGYPNFSSCGVQVNTLFNPDITLPGKFELKSSVPAANGTWNVAKISHALTSEMPGGPWFSMIEGYPENGTG